MKVRLSPIRIGAVFEPLKIWESTFLRTAGLSLFGMGLALAVPFAAALMFGEPADAFMFPTVFCFVISLPLLLMVKAGGDVRPVDGLLLMFAVWGIAMAVAAVPFIWSGMSVTDGVFESVSGFTTTGSTVMYSPSYPAPMNSLILWKALIQWIGGIAIILIFMSLFPLLGFGGRRMFRNEMSGSGSRNFTIRMRDAAKEFSVVYGILSGIFLIVCTSMGTEIFDSVCLTFSTISTGGFLPHNGNAGSYPVLVQALIVIFMFLGGTNFYLHYQRLYRKSGAGYLKNSEFRSMIIFYSAAVLIISAMTCTVMGTDVPQHIWDVIFTVISLGTSSGIMITGIGWATAVPAAMFVLLFLMFVGGSAGSTAGGIKIGRLVTLMKSLTLDLKERLYPRAVFDVKVGGEALDDETVSATYVLVLLFIMTITAGTLALVILEPLGITDAAVVSLTSVTNSGLVDPYAPGGIAAFSDGGKIAAMLLMWVGRLEIGTAIILFTPFFWREIIRGKRKIGRVERE